MRVSVGLGPQTVDFRLFKLGQVSGRVVDSTLADGEPGKVLGGYQVTISRVVGYTVTLIDTQNSRADRRRVRLGVGPDAPRRDLRDRGPGTTARVRGRARPVHRPGARPAGADAVHRARDLRTTRSASTTSRPTPTPSCKGSCTSPISVPGDVVTLNKSDVAVAHGDPDLSVVGAGQSAGQRARRRRCSFRVRPFPRWAGSSSPAGWSATTSSSACANSRSPRPATAREPSPSIRRSSSATARSERIATSVFRCSPTSPNRSPASCSGPTARRTSLSKVPTFRSTSVIVDFEPRQASVETTEPLAGDPGAPGDERGRRYLGVHRASRRSSGHRSTPSRAPTSTTRRSWCG